MNSAKHLCPLVKKEHEECYFMKMTSSNIQKTVLYCVSDFKSCEIYKRLCPDCQDGK